MAKGIATRTVCFCVPDKIESLKNDYQVIYAGMADRLEDVSEIRVDEELKTMEAAIFIMSNEMEYPDAIFLYDFKSEGYDPAVLIERLSYHFPAAKLVLMTHHDEIDAEETFTAYTALHYIVKSSNADELSTFARNVDNLEPVKDLLPGTKVYTNESRVRENAKFADVIPVYSKEAMDGLFAGFNDIRLLNTPTPPKTPPAVSVSDILARPRKTGKVLLVIPSQYNVYGVKIKPAYPALGVMWIGAMLDKAGHKTQIIDQDADNMGIDRILEKIREEQIDIVGFTAVTSTYPNALEMAKKIKRQDSKTGVLLGGIHATIDPIECAKQESFDFVVVGEAECTAVELVDAIMAGTADDVSAIKGLVYRGKNGKVVSTGARVLEPNLDNYPFPAHHLIRNLNKYEPSHATYLPVAPVMASRGCPGQCTYCQTKNIFGRRTRFRSPQDVINEIRMLVNDFGVKEIHFLDDVLTASRPFIKEFCALLKNEPYKLHLEVANGLRADMVNEEILTALKEVGLKNVGFGIETGNEDIVKMIKKGIKLDQVRKAIRTAKQVGLETWGFFMVGLPGENEKTIQDTVNFAIELDPKYAKFLIFKPFPGSEAYYQIDELGLVDNRDYSQYGVYTQPVHHLPTLSQAKILQLQKRAFRKFYLRPKKIIEHIFAIRSLGNLVTVFRGMLFTFARMFKKESAGLGMNTGG